MLLAVEGGGFFSSSASGYSKGLTLLLLGRRNEERPMRVSPWNHYQLVEEEIGPDPQLASKKNRVPHGCNSFICFGCSSSELDVSSPPKVGSFHRSESMADTSSSVRDEVTTNDSIDENDKKTCLKSSLKKSSAERPVVVQGDDAPDSLEEVQSNIPYCTERKVQWTDTCGRALAEIKEFELSDECTSDDDSERGGVRRCGCAIQ